MGRYRPQDLYASSGTPHGARAEAIASGAITENDILIVNGISSGLMQVVRADADALLTARGFLWVSLGTVVSGARVEMVPWRLVRNVNTAGTAVGDPIFAAQAAGGWVATAPVDAVSVQVGEIVVVSATAGAVVLAPNGAFGSEPLVPAVADPGTGAAIALGFASGSVGFTIAAGVAETNTLAVPSFQGQRLYMVAVAVGAAGSRAVTAAAAINQAGNTILTFAQANDWILLEGIRIGATFRWRVVANDGVALS